MTWECIYIWTICYVYNNYLKKMYNIEFFGWIDRYREMILIIIIGYLDKIAFNKIYYCT